MKRAAPAILLLAVLALAACASPAEIGKMVVQTPATGPLTNPDLEGNIRVGTVTGGEETNPLWTSEVSSPDFGTALEVSLSNRGLLAPTAPGKYTLDANMLGMSQPVFGIDFTVTTHVNYILKNTETQEPLVEETITSDFTATMSDSVIGVTRLKIANEGSARENIRRFLDTLYKQPPL